MDEVLKKELMENENQIKQKKHFRILGITIWRIFAYFIIYSFIGFIVETIFGIAKYRSDRK